MHLTWGYRQFHSEIATHPNVHDENMSLTMTTTKKLILCPLTALCLFMSACSDNKAPTEQTSTTASQAVEAQTTTTNSNTTVQGNWQTKPAELSSNTSADIQADLAALNQITNSVNSKAVALRDEMQTIANDPAKMSEALKKTNDLQEQVKTEIMALHLKSAEVQAIRTDMIDNLMTANQLYIHSTAADFNPAAPSKEVQQLTQRSLAIQQKISTELNALNQKYAQ